MKRRSQPKVKSIGSYSRKVKTRNFMYGGYVNKSDPKTRQLRYSK